MLFDQNRGAVPIHEEVDFSTVHRSSERNFLWLVVSWTRMRCHPRFELVRASCNQCTALHVDPRRNFLANDGSPIDRGDREVQSAGDRRIIPRR